MFIDIATQRLHHTGPRRLHSPQSPKGTPLRDSGIRPFGVVTQKPIRCGKAPLMLRQSAH